MIPALFVLGFGVAVASLTLWRSATLHPDPNSIHPKEGLDHMMTHLLGWVGFGLCFTGGLALLGLPLPLAGLAFAVWLRWSQPHPALIPFYRWQLPLAAGALGIGLVLWGIFPIRFAGLLSE